VKITSLTIGGSEWISKVIQEGTEITKELGGSIGTATIVVEDTHSNITGITMQSEIIVYSGGVKIFGGYIAQIEQVKINSTTSRATLYCQDYSVLLERTVVTTEESYSSQSDETIIDDLFTTYLSSISTTPVVTVESSMSITFPASTSLRRCLEMIAERTGAEWYVDASKALHYFDPAADPEASTSEPDRAGIILAENPSVSLDWSPGDADVFTAVGASWAPSTGTLSEDTSTGEHRIHWGTTVTAGDPYVFSVVVEAAGRQWISMAVSADAIFPWRTWFDLANGTIGSKMANNGASIISLGAGKYLCSLSGFFDSTGGSTFILNLATADATLSYTGDGSSGIIVHQFSVRTGYGYLRNSFRHVRDGATMANSVQVIGGQRTASGSPLQGKWVDSYDDIVVLANSSTWPPSAGYTTVNSIDPSSYPKSMLVRAGWNGTKYNYDIVCVRFDTSDIPDDATITAATLRLNVNTYAESANFQWGIEYYSSSNWPIGTSDWTYPVGNDAYGYAAPTYPASGQLPGWMEFSLKNPDANINKTGWTGFRIGLYYVGSGSPTDEEKAFWFSFTGAEPHQLVIEYEYPTPTGSASDSTSIATYGTLKRTIVDTTITSDAEATLRAQAEVARYKDPSEYGSLETRADGLDIGRLLRITSSTYGIDGDYLIRALRIRQEVDDVTLYSVDYGDLRPDAVRLIRRLKQLQENQP